jgi:hypothetical protein
MLSSLTADDIYAQIILLRDTDNRTLLLLEGDTDCNLIDVHLSDDCASVPAYSKQAAIGAARLAHHDGDERVLALVDRDWMGIFEDPAPAPNVFFTDAYDMEATLFCIDDLRARVINASSNRRPPATIIAALVDLAVEAAVAIAATRFASLDNGWALGMRGFPVQEIMDLDKYSVDVLKMCTLAVRRSGASIDISRALAEVEWLIEVLAHAAFCSGHDLMKALSLVIRTKLNGSVGEAQLAAMFRAALNFELLAITEFFVEINTWAESRNQRVWRKSSGRVGSE